MAERQIPLSTAQRVIGRLVLENELLAEELLERDRAIADLRAAVAEVKAAIAEGEGAPITRQPASRNARKVRGG